MNDRAKAWGSPDREYAYDPGSADSYELYLDPDFRPLPDVEHQSSIWSEAVRRSLGDEPQTVVERTVKQWNGVVREYLRKQTGLRLSKDLESKRTGERNRKVRAVPVRVDSGLPIRFATAVRSITSRDVMLLLNRSKFESVVSGTSFMEEHYQELSKIQIDSSCIAKLDEIKSACGFAQGILEYIKGLEHIENNGQAGKILDIDEDILGAYFFNLPEIRLYWIVIGVCSQILNLPIEALTVVVLVHELAHAYTHLGYDIDNRDWKTKDFAAADVPLVEGLAQFYTEVICEQIESRFPAAKIAFRKLLKNQSEVYKEHRNWSTSRDSEHVGETVRISMLECRSKGILDIGQFREIVARSQETFREQLGRLSDF